MMSAAKRVKREAEAETGSVVRLRSYMSTFEIVAKLQAYKDGVLNYLELATVSRLEIGLQFLSPPVKDLLRGLTIGTLCLGCGDTLSSIASAILPVLGSVARIDVENHDNSELDVLLREAGNIFNLSTLNISQEKYYYRYHAGYLGSFPSLTDLTYSGSNAPTFLGRFIEGRPLRHLVVPGCIVQSLVSAAKHTLLSLECHVAPHDLTLLSLFRAVRVLRLTMQDRNGYHWLSMLPCPVSVMHVTGNHDFKDLCEYPTLEKLTIDSVHLRGQLREVQVLVERWVGFPQRDAMKHTLMDALPSFPEVLVDMVEEYTRRSTADVHINDMQCA